MRHRDVLLSLALLALVACQHERVAFAPDALQGVEPLPAQVNPYLWALTERWQTWRASGLPLDTFPEVCEWRMEQILAEDFLPEAYR